MINTIILLAGGLATRLKPVTETIPKSMIEIAGKPFIEHQLLLIRKNKISNVIICAGFLGEMLEEFTGKNNSFGLDIKYSYDGEKLLGTGGAVKKAMDLSGDNFFVMYGDSYLTADYQKAGDFFLRGIAKGLMTVYKNENKFDKSNIEFTDGNIKSYSKSVFDEKMKYIDYGLGIFNRSAFDDYKDKEVFDLASVFQNLLTKNDLCGYEVRERFYEIGSFEGLEETNRYLLGI